jgi:hypothetical protein
MFSRIRRIWHPDHFHYHHRLRGTRNCFEGWYFKLVDPAGSRPLAVIPGVFLGPDAHAFIQVLDGSNVTAAYHRFPIEAFTAARGAFDIRIAGSRFTRSAIELDIEADHENSNPGVRGTVSFGDWHGWPVTLTRPGVMGPYGFAPFMQCNHGILSMDHELAGGLQVGDNTVSYDGGRGYAEKDWGTGFPKGYVWVQCNRFPKPGVSLSASIANIPWLTGAFRGYLIGVLADGRLYRFTTYTGARIDRIEADDQRLEVSVSDNHYRLEYSATRSDGGVLRAPYERSMVERVAESMDSVVHVRLERKDNGQILLEDSGTHGCLEMQGDLDAVLQGTGGS